MQAQLIFFEHLKKEFFPKLNSLGFTGTALNYRRVTHEVVNIVFVQEHHAGHCCRLNMGLHLKFLPASWARHALRPDKITFPDCEFQMGLTASHKHDGWWPYQRLFRSSTRCADKMIEVYLSQGESRFNQFKTPADFTALFKPEDFQTGKWDQTRHGFRPHRGALTMARIHSYLGNIAEAKAFARIGLELVAPNTALAIDCQKILDAC